MQLIFSCCRGEHFLRLPLFGLVHIPSAGFIDLFVSLMLPGYVAGLVLLSLCFFFCFRSLTSKNSKSFYVWSTLPILSFSFAYGLLGGILLPGEVGRQIAMMIQPPAKNEFARYNASKHLIESWERNPKIAPLANITHNALPASNIPFWSETRAREIAAQVLALKDTNWTYSAALGRGSGLFLLGRKYNGAKQAGDFISLDEQTELGMSLWETFGTVMEEFRQGTESLIGAPCHLYKETWPPTFIMHAGSVMSTHFEVMDVHTDKILHQPYREQVERDIGQTCNWQSQLSLLVALNMPPGGGGAFDYYDSSGTKTTIEHKLGKGILAECQRPHNLHEFHPADIDSDELRMVLHAFLVPCRGAGKETEWQILGPLGFGAPFGDFEKTVAMAVGIV